MTDLFETTCHCCGQTLPERQASPFSAFWDKWPSKKAKAAAEKAFAKLTVQEKTTATDVCARWFAKWRKENPQASDMLAASFLNGKRFEDEGLQAQTKTDVAAFWADSIQRKRFVSPTVITPSIATEMLARELVTKTQLREIGIVT